MIGSSPHLRGTLASNPSPSFRDAVHPRTCGERMTSVSVSSCTFGSSPHLRGTPARFEPGRPGVRFIPAPAGNAGGLPRRSGGRPVHPRTCGERTMFCSWIAISVGSSPYLRGTRFLVVGVGLFNRFIPAPAGNAICHALDVGNKAVHPRTCGERVFKRARLMPRDGSSPHLRGTRPMGRGASTNHRFIPAPAGNASNDSYKFLAKTVHPRTCGERRAPAATAAARPGSSPHLRGTRRATPGPAPAGRFIPAPAGNADDCGCLCGGGSVHPRTCGERFALRELFPEVHGSSPHLRGTHHMELGQHSQFRFIPAPAGNARSTSRPASSSPVHPRTCGER
ncbi:hypothetical protein SAMN05421693_10163 [Ectothiorhodospira magna]|uniref:Uncharacterized protein n=1 Tax=Ectothiorhodospira magna TaxID=867345 RepID=A0A1H8YYA1_9GAMM|nr:hypothetical protein SAMN05421693_10163 [Ectothiorhodospira magna]